MIIMLLIKIYQMRLFEVNDYEEDLNKEQKRMKNMRTTNPYVKDYCRKLK